MDTSYIDSFEQLLSKIFSEGTQPHSPQFRELLPKVVKIMAPIARYKNANLEQEIYNYFNSKKVSLDSPPWMTEEELRALPVAERRLYNEKLFALSAIAELQNLALAAYYASLNKIKIS